MTTLWAWLAVVHAALAALCAMPILVHAFRRSVGTGVMVLCIPGYLVLYGFSQFDHPRRHWWVPGLVGAVALCGVFSGLAGPLR